MFFVSKDGGILPKGKGLWGIAWFATRRSPVRFRASPFTNLRSDTGSVAASRNTADSEPSGSLGV